VVRWELPLLGSNLDSPDPASGVHQDQEEFGPPVRGRVELPTSRSSATQGQRWSAPTRV